MTIQPTSALAPFRYAIIAVAASAALEGWRRLRRWRGRARHGATPPPFPFDRTPGDDAPGPLWDAVHE